MFLLSHTDRGSHWGGNNYTTTSNTIYIWDKSHTWYFFRSSPALGPDPLYSLTKWVNRPREHMGTRDVSEPKEQMNRAVDRSASRPHPLLPSQCLLGPTQHCLFEPLGAGQHSAVSQRPPRSAQVHPLSPFLSLRTTFSSIPLPGPLSCSF